MLAGTALVVAIFGMAYPFFSQSPQEFASVASAMFASADATLSVSVPENPYNSLAQQLRVKQLTLQEREAALNAREAREKKLTLGEIAGFISFMLSIVLCILVGINFYLDSKRRKKGALVPGRFQVDLR